MIIVLIDLTSCFEKNKLYIDNIDSLLIDKKITFPITSNKDAIIYAINIEEVSKSIIFAKNQSNYKTWIAESCFTNNNLWEVIIKSTGKIIPSYQCTARFENNGDEKSSIIICKYNK
jgi:hypothetical protein